MIGTRVVNIIAWFKALRPLTTEFDIAIITIGQLWPHDSPMNLIEHMWNFGSKKLSHTVIPAFDEGDDVIPSRVTGISDEKKNQKEY